MAFTSFKPKINSVIPPILLVFLTLECFKKKIDYRFLKKLTTNITIYCQAWQELELKQKTKWFQKWKEYENQN